MAEQQQVYQIKCKCPTHKKRIKYFTLKQGESNLYCQKCSAPNEKITIEQEVQTILSNISKKKESLNEKLFKQKEKQRIQSYLNFLRNRNNYEQEQWDWKIESLMKNEQDMLKSKFDKHNEQVKKMMQIPYFENNWKNKKQRYLQIIMTDKYINVQKQLVEMKKNLTQLYNYLINDSILSELQDLVDQKISQQNRKQRNQNK